MTRRVGKGVREELRRMMHLTRRAHAVGAFNVAAVSVGTAPA